jgi:hypothetical protein
MAKRILNKMTLYKISARCGRFASFNYFFLILLISALKLEAFSRNCHFEDANFQKNIVQSVLQIWAS